jgi:flavin-dependent dehydrogenase
LISSDVVVVGGGPAGIAAAIAAALQGLQVTVLDSRTPPIDKPCGEGLLPEAVAALHTLGVELNSSVAFPFCGIRFCDENSSATARVTRGQAFGVRRTTLHGLLVERAQQLGVAFAWETRIARLNADSVQTIAGPSADPGTSTIRYNWLIGADGQNSMVRSRAGMGATRYRRSRFGFRRHYRVGPWTDVVEVHWGRRCQMFVTPTAPDEVCIALISNDSHMRIADALKQFPEIAEKLRGAACVAREGGAITALGRARRVVRENVVLVGDASCAIDGVAGQGLSLAFQEALALGEALGRGDLSLYERAHREITQPAMRMTQLLLLMDRSAWIRRKTLRLFASQPALYSKMMAVHTGAAPADSLCLTDLASLSLRVLAA